MPQREQRADRRAVLHGAVARVRLRIVERAQREEDRGRARRADTHELMHRRRVADAREHVDSGARRPCVDAMLGECVRERRVHLGFGRRVGEHDDGTRRDGASHAARARVSAQPRRGRAEFAARARGVVGAHVGDLAHEARRRLAPTEDKRVAVLAHRAAARGDVSEVTCHRIAHAHAADKDAKNAWPATRERHGANGARVVTGGAPRAQKARSRARRVCSRLVRLSVTMIKRVACGRSTRLETLTHAVHTPP